MKKHCFLLILSFLLTASVYSQSVAINTTGAKPDESAMLDISSTVGGLLIPRVTVLQRNAIGSPATGLLVYQTNGVTGFYVYNGSNWDLIWAGSPSIDALSDGRVIGSSVYLGSSAGVLDDGTNNYNVGVGTQVLNQNIEGFFNVAAGHQALYNNTQSWNTAIGYQSLYNNQIGKYNTGLGFRSGYFNSSGSYNTSIGYGSNLYNETGSNNTIIGYQAGYGTALHNKSGNVFLGYQAGYSETGSNKLYIENSNSNSPLIYGEFNNDLLRVNGTLHIGNAYHFPLSDGTSGQVLSTDGSGALAWSTLGSGGGITQLNDLTDAKTGGNSVFLGSDSGGADDASDNRNSALGIASLYSNTTGLYNSAMGYRASYHNTTGNYNIIHGPFADYRNQGGSRNVMIGYQAGYSSANHSKSGNIRIGYQAGLGDTTDNKLYIENTISSTPLIWGDFDADSVRINGDLVVTGKLSGNFGIDDLNDGRAISSSVFLGDEAGGNDDGTDNKNTAVGYQTLKDATGELNIAFGYQAAQEMTTGNYNIAIGASANGNNLGGEKNVIIGNNAGFRFSDHNNSGNIFIGYSAGFNTDANNKLFIENSSSSTPLIWGDFEKDSVVINGDFGITGEWTGLGLDDLWNGRYNYGSVFLGRTAGENDYGANYNVGVGDSSMYANIDGWYCVAVGKNALYKLTSGLGNTAIGDRSIMKMTSGSYITGIGYAALHNNTIGEENTAVGSLALFANTTGDNNTAIGYESLHENKSGNSNSAFGRRSLHDNTTGHSNVAFGSETLSKNTLGKSNTAVGTFSMFWNNSGNENTGIGHFSLLNNDSGIQNTAIGDSTLLKNTIGSNNTALGTNALQENVAGNTNTAIGSYALHKNTVSQNIAVGDSALFSNTTGLENTAVGSNALSSNQSGNYNTALGFKTLLTNTASSNTAVGSFALLKNTTGEDNAALGDQAMQRNTIGDNNVAFGTRALLYNKEGNENTAIGSDALGNNEYGDYNTAIGTYAGNGPGFIVNNSIALGHGVAVNTNNRAEIGNTSMTWIGGQVTWSTFSDARMKENIKEDVSGLDFIMKLRPVSYHVKKDGIDRILGVRDDRDYPEKYDIEKVKQTGFVAQEVEQAALESGYNFSGVRKPENENTPYSLSYAQFVVPLVKAVQEQQEEIEELKQQIITSTATKEDQSGSQGSMNTYNGNVISDSSGYAEVHIPGIPDSGQIEYRYQLTVIGDFAQAIISKEISGNQFEIRTDKPNVKVSWQVMGEWSDVKDKK
ncbi:MAG: hypothetical protein HKN67_05920 [Saprospiraceae bacterium]|nr:hypothetical protein [Saprospiraceae bacterium]